MMSDVFRGFLTYISKRPSLYYIRVKGWVGGIAKYLLFLIGVGGCFEGEISTQI